MIIAITGGTGFIGKRLVLRHLDAGDEVRVLTRRAFADSGLPYLVKLFRGDLSEDMGGLQGFVDGVDVLYHCAAELKDESKMRGLHVDGTRRLLCAAKGRVGRLLLLSSVGAYGVHRSGIVTEETPLKPEGIYETTKVGSEHIVKGAAKDGAFTYTILRPSTVYGPGMPNQSLYNMITMIRKRLFFYIGRPGAMANYIYVDNVVEALLRCARMSLAENQTFNLSDQCTFEEFIGTIAEDLHVSKPQMRMPEIVARWMAKLFQGVPCFPLTESRVDALTNRVIYSNDKIERDLAYRHPVSIREGLKRMVTAHD